jgi:hypothetical protein
MTEPKKLTTNQRTLVNNLTRELFQTETSAVRHSKREAARLGDTAPAHALRSVAAHAEEVLPQLPQLAERNGLIVSKGGMVVGELFSQTRDKFADMLIDSERSYRGTLLGMRHGVDVVRLLEEFARSVDNAELTQFCTQWLERRQPLVQEVDAELRWFAQNPDEAVRIARPLFARGRARRRATAHAAE